MPNPSPRPFAGHVAPLLTCLVLALAFGRVASGDPGDDALVEWVKSSAIPIKTVDAGNGLEDLQPVKQIVGSARVVSLGESTHGTREHFRMKHRLLELLVREMGFTVFGIEASMPDCAGINDYVLGGAGDPERAVAGQGFWTWNTEEVLDMVQWMRAYNDEARAAGKPLVKFYGFDMQSLPSAVNGALKYLEKVDPEAASGVNPKVQFVFEPRRPGEPMAAEQTAAIDAAMREIGEHFDRNKDAYIAKSSADEFGVARRYVVVAQQALATFDEARQQSSSIGRAAEMQLFQVAPKDAKDLLLYLREEHPELAVVVEDMLNSISRNFNNFWETYNDDATPDAQRDAYDAQFERIKTALGGLEQTKDAAEHNRARERAKSVGTLLKVFREYRAKPDRNRVENVRDRSMAENVAWILAHEGPAAKIVCWSHNGHANVADPRPGRGSLMMGSYLERAFKDDHVAVGFSFNKGSFQAAAGPRAATPGLQEWTVGPAKAASVDAALARAGVPIFVLDLRAAPDGPVKQSLMTERPMRSIGAIFDPAAEETAYYAPTALGKVYDAIVFTDTTTRARPLKIQSFSSMNPASVEAARKPRLGVRLSEPDDGRPGLIIDEVIDGLSAHAAGLREGDRILKIGDTAITEIPHVRQATSKYDDGQTVPITIERDGAEQVVQVKLLGGMR